jgi:uncharacterized glyoxalase superfamily protein PhnB
MATDPTAPTIYPTVRYDDAPAAIRFLVGAFGFGQQEVNTSDDGRVGHALLSWGNGLLMISSRIDRDKDPFDHGTTCVYLAVDDPDAHHARAVAAGAEIVMGLTDQDYGSREYAAKDPEGHVWCFGTYQPAVEAASAPAGADAAAPR